MFFTSILFIFSFIIFFLLYWLAGKNRPMLQNVLLLCGNCLFYAYIDWHFLFFLIGVSALYFFLGIQIEKAQAPKHRRAFLLAGLVVGIGSLAFFKYFNFFIGSFNHLFQAIGLNGNLHTLKIIVPVGISYFTFKAIGYLLDVDKGKMDTTRDALAFFNYMAFFPTILSGPIDNARLFIPQLQAKRNFDYAKATSGMRQILWGAFKKMVIADNLSLVVDPIFANYVHMPSSSLLLGAFFYAIQLYTDFSGYSDMAIGIGRLLGFNVTRNFDFPFFAQNIAEFWRKWHISLTAWLTEYIFTPLSIAFRDWGKTGLVLAIVINFTICGIWHGANWTYVLFGFVHGCLFVPLIIKGTMNKKKRVAKDRSLPSLKELLNMAINFIVVMFVFVIFRSESVMGALLYYKSIFTPSGFAVTDFQQKWLEGKAFVTLFLLLFLLIMEWQGRNDQFAIEKTGMKRPIWARWVLYAFLVFLIGMFTPTVESPFIYLKF